MRSGRTTDITLRPLGQADVTRMIADTFGRGGGDEEIGALAALVFQKTEGNPFFVNQFLGSLHFPYRIIELPERTQTPGIALMRDRQIRVQLQSAAK